MRSGKRFINQCLYKMFGSEPESGKKQTLKWKLNKIRCIKSTNESANKMKKKKKRRE